MKKVGVHRAGLGPYSLRHVFRTIADGARDQVACNLLMGHSDPSMGAVYTERIGDDRLRRVSDCYRFFNNFLRESPKGVNSVRP